jgi:hypothetical protein
MKIILHFILTAAISTGSLLAATKAAHPWPYFGIMAFVWIIFAWRLNQRSKRHP